MENFFQFKKYGTNLRTEIIAGVTTFFTMAYILFVNPQILSATGMDPGGVYVATIICTVIGTLFMALFANVPYALAPGMGLNAFFTYTVCIVMGFSWQQALALVLICGIINTIITVSGLRKMIIKAMPKTLLSAISGGIGMFIAYIGVKDGGLLKFTADAPFLSVIPAANPASSSLSDQVGTVVASSGAVPAFVTFNSPAAILTIIGLIIMVILLVRKVKGAILIGIVATTIIGLLFGVTKWTGMDLSAIGGIKNTAFKMDFPGLFTNPGRLMLAVTAAIGFCLTDIFDCIGTFLGTGRKTGIFGGEDEKLFMEGKGLKSRMDRALFADLIATTTGAFFGTSNTTTYVESASGISEGGRTGMTSVVTAVLFAICILFTPLASIVPASATAPALIVVGVMMMSSFLDIQWDKFEIAAPAFLCAVIMPFTYGITNGIAAGFIVYSVIHIALGKFKSLHPIIIGTSVLFLINYILQAVYRL